MKTIDSLVNRFEMYNNKPRPKIKVTRNIKPFGIIFYFRLANFLTYNSKTMFEFIEFYRKKIYFKKKGIWEFLCVRTCCTV
jgi:hypothetical protein